MNPNNRLIIILISAGSLLLIPLIAMQYSNEVNWTLSDFVIAGFLLFGTGLLCEWVMRTVRLKTIRYTVCAGIILLLLTVWAELAVGIFD